MLLLLQQRKRNNKEASVQGVDAGVRLRLPPASTPSTEVPYECLSMQDTCLLNQETVYLFRTVYSYSGNMSIYLGNFRLMCLLPAGKVMKSKMAKCEIVKFE